LKKLQGFRFTFKIIDLAICSGMYQSPANMILFEEKFAVFWWIDVGRGNNNGRSYASAAIHAMKVLFFFE